MALAIVAHRMLATPIRSESAESPVFRDGLGERRLGAESNGELVQSLHLSDAPMALPEFEFALRERVARWSSIRHASFVRVCRVDRLKVPAMRFALVSEYVNGPRLSELLLVAHQREVVVDVAAAVSLTRQLLAATALLHEQAPDVASGLIAPERLIVTPQGRVAIAEQALCTAIEQLPDRPERLWRKFRIATNSAPDARRFNHRSDLLNIGLVTLSLLLGRPLADEDFPDRIPALLGTARERSPLGHDRPLSLPFREWLTRALQLDAEWSFASPSDAWIAFERVAATDSLYMSSAIAIEVLLHTCGASPSRPVAAKPTEPAAATSRLMLQHRARVVSTKVASTHATPVPSGVKPTLPSVLTDPEIRTTMLPADYVADASAPPATPDAIDWAKIATRPAAVATPGDITQLFADPDVPARAERIVAANPAEPQVRSVEVSIPAGDGDRSTVAATPVDCVDRAAVVPPDWSAPTSASPTHSRKPKMIVAASVAAVLAASAGMVWLSRSAIVRPAEMGFLRVDSNPTGLLVLVDGIEQGRTPARLSVSAGTHVMEVQGRNAPRVIPVSVTSGIESTQYIEFPDRSQTAQLRIDSDPARHIVNIQAGATSAIHAPAVAPSTSETPTWGWVTTSAAFPVDIRVGGKVLGSAGDRVRMTAGRHQIELVNEGRGFRSVRTVDVVPGKVTSVGIDTPPAGLVSLNASPWAELWIDGRRIGETPLANLSVPAGEHEVVFRHPEIGEKRQVLRVNPGARLRLSVEMK